MKIIDEKNKIEISELKEICEKGFFVHMIKAVVDIEKKIMAIDAELHVDLEQFLIESQNSEPKNLWGINLYPEKQGNDFIEFDSMINLKPARGNKTRGVENSATREAITKIVETLCNIKI